ncbi:hypothetical protein ALC60_03875, partial [Trachymyrmex zeteki]
VRVAQREGGSRKKRENRGGDVSLTGDRNASVQPGDALETELERTRRLTVVDDVADGLWLDLILTLRFAYAPPLFDESPSFIEKRDLRPSPRLSNQLICHAMLLLIDFT